MAHVLRPTVALALTTVFVVACDDTPTTDDDTDAPVPTFEDTYTPPSETDDTEPSGNGKSPTDTGAFYMFTFEGVATVLEDSFVGHEALVARWFANGEDLSEPRCIYAHPIADWVTDGNVPANDPLSSAGDCPDCTFSFTMVFQPVEEVERFPWNDDTDPDAIDIVVADKLNCDNLVEKQDYPAADEVDTTIIAGLDQDYFGYGFSPTYDGDDDDSTGAWMVYLGNVGWQPYDYNATFDADSGEFRWAGITPTPYPYY